MNMKMKIVEWKWTILSVLITTISLILTIVYGFPFLFLMIFPPLFLGRKKWKFYEEKLVGQYCENCGYQYQGFEQYCPICGFKKNK
ncbi:MAG: hypothetical protein ACTSSL_06030 [Candidatus Heimdallarchaeaceae archaeon]